MLKLILKRKIQKSDILVCRHLQHWRIEHVSNSKWLQLANSIWNPHGPNYFSIHKTRHLEKLKNIKVLKSQSSKKKKKNVAVWSLPTHIKRTIPVLDIAKANPRIPLPMIALLRLKTDMPNEVFPSNWKRVRQRRFHIKIWNHCFTLQTPKVPIGCEHSRQWSGFLSWRHFYAAGTPRVRPCYPPHQSYKREWIGIFVKEKQEETLGKKRSLWPDCHSFNFILDFLHRTHRPCCVRSSSEAPFWLLRLCLARLLLVWRDPAATYIWLGMTVEHQSTKCIHCFFRLHCKHCFLCPIHNIPALLTLWSSSVYTREVNYKEAQLSPALANNT